MVRATGCDGVVVGRGCLGRPWLFRDLADALAGRPVQPAPPLGEVTDVMRRHAAMLAEQNGEEAAVRDFRKHVPWYLTGYAADPGPATRAETLAGLDAALADLDPDATAAPGSDAAPRGTTAGPQRVSVPDGWLDGSAALPYDADLLASGG
jgi:tRNA-dihydrouridine synthase